MKEPLRFYFPELNSAQIARLRLMINQELKDRLIGLTKLEPAAISTQAYADMIRREAEALLV